MARGASGLGTVAFQGRICKLGNTDLCCSLHREAGEPGGALLELAGEDVVV